MKKAFPLSTLVPLISFLALIGLLTWILMKKPSNASDLSLENQFSENSRSSTLPMIQAHKTFNLPTVTDPTRRVTQDSFKDKVTLLNVWASWCGPCRREIDFLLTVSKIPGLYWVGLNLHDDLMEAQKILLIYGNPYHETIYDKEGRLAIHLGVRGTPELFILDKQGRVQYRHGGPINEILWKETIWPIIQRLQEE